MGETTGTPLPVDETGATGSEEADEMGRGD
jgi:hypothetical protein